MNIDIIRIICLYLSIKDKINFLSSKNEFHKLKNIIFFNDQICQSKIINLFYYNQFTNILTNNTINYPHSMIKLTFTNKFNQGIKGIPLRVTHLTFGWYFNQDIKGAIPSNVTHLHFDYCFNQDIKGAIPLSVTHLTFGQNFNQDIKDAIPSSIKYLVLINNKFDKDLKGAIPSGIHLTLHNVCYQNRKNELDALCCEIETCNLFYKI